MSRRTALSARQQPLQNTQKGFWALSKSPFFTKQGHFSAVNLCQVLFSNSLPFAGLGTRTAESTGMQNSEQWRSVSSKERPRLEVSPRANMGTGHTSLLLTESRKSLFEAKDSQCRTRSVCICMCPFYLNTARDELLKLCRGQDHQNAPKSS